MAQFLTTARDLGRVFLLAQVPLIPFYVATLWSMLAQ